jgi:hypothetical protein
MRSVVVFLSLLAAGAAGAQEPHRRHAQEPSPPIDCYCRAEGRMFAEGEQVCLKTAEGPRLALCDMEINVMSWSITETPCPDS